MESIDESVNPSDARLFLVLAEELHFGRAAERLGMAQPQLSKRLRRLEAQLGTPLLARSSRRVQLTAAGEQLRGPLADWLQQGAQLAQQARRAARGEAGELRLAMVSPAGFGELPRWLRAFRDRRPGVRLSLRELTLDLQLDLLARGELDAGFVLHPAGSPPPAFGWARVGSEPLVLALSTAQAARLGPRPRRAALWAEPLVLFPRDIAPALHDAVLSFYREQGVDAQPAQRAVQMATLVHLVSADFGLAWVPASMQALQRAGVEYRPAPTGAPQAETWLLAPPAPSPVLRAFLESLPLRR